MSQPKDVLLASAEQLQQAAATVPPGREREWAARVAGAMAGVGRALRKHGTPGLFEQVDLERPSLAHQAAELSQEHRELLARAEALEAEARAAAGAEPPASPDFGLLRQRVQQCAAALSEHRQDENGLVIESVTTDLGAAD